MLVCIILYLHYKLVEIKINTRHLKRKITFKKNETPNPTNWTKVHLIDIDRLCEDPGLVFCLQLVQKGSEQNTEGSQLHFQETFLLFNL